MKIKSIIAGGLLLLGVGATTTSCEDMFTPENKLVATELAPQDTLYQIMGIIQRMQKLADRTVLLGEVRADLVDVDPIHAPKDVQELAANNISATNVYNQPADYYAVINNCNIYLTNVDSMRNSQGTRKYFEKEICAVKCFRAWCYLELVKNYGEVPFITEPVLSSEAAEEIVASGNKANMDEILQFCINDLQKYPDMDDNEELRQAYDKKNRYGNITYNQMMIPVRALLAELHLWHGSFTNNQDDYIKAIGLYHDYFAFPKEEIVATQNKVEWSDREFQRKNTTQASGGEAGIIPLDTTAYYGNTSDLRSIFCSQYSNYYYPAVTPSQRMKDISKAQDYCYFDYDTRNVIIAPHDANAYREKIEEGDLRLSSNYTIGSNFAESQYNSNMNSQTQNITKYSGNIDHIESIPIFRNTILYIHLAEALNRAGFPETAYAILSHGLSYYTLNDRDLISQEEFDRLCQIKSRGFTAIDAAYQDDDLAKTTGTFVIWDSGVFNTYDKVNSTRGNKARFGMGNLIQEGIHSTGSGDTEFNDNYYLDDAETLSNLRELLRPIPPTVPVWAGKKNDPDSTLYRAALEQYDLDYAAYQNDSLTDVESVEYNRTYLATPEIRVKRQARVAELVLEEEALETAFEGHRFYDIMRYQMQEKGGEGIGKTITLPEWITKKYGATSRMEGKPWYLTLPRR